MREEYPGSVKIFRFFQVFRKKVFSDTVIATKHTTVSLISTNYFHGFNTREPSSSTKKFK